MALWMFLIRSVRPMPHMSRLSQMMLKLQYPRQVSHIIWNDESEIG